MGGRTTQNPSSYQAVRQRFEAHGQEHVFRFWDRLTAPERDALLSQCAALDLPALERAFAGATRAHEGPAGKLEPIPVEPSESHGGEPGRIARARETGDELLRQGRVAALVLAGGQATRLGFDGPKGAYPIGPVSDRSLFAVQAGKLRRLAQRLGRPVPWYVMTSPATDAATRACFESHAFFGLSPGDVGFFVQGMVPSFDFEGRLVLAARDRLMQNPDGHGGSLLALADSGALADMQGRGVDVLFTYQVDNPLVRMADPAFLGFHAEAGAEMSCKVVRKTDPDEKVGILARRAGQVGVVEYTELEDEYRYARDAEGNLVYWAGNIAIHALQTAFIERVVAQADRWLPFHASQKKLSGVDDEGRRLAPDRPNGLKLERFLFDALPAAREIRVVEADRAREFSPVKNARGDDSPETARRDLSAEYARWLAEAGFDTPAAARIEIDPTHIDGPEDARCLGAENLANRRDIVRIESGAPR